MCKYSFVLEFRDLRLQITPPPFPPKKKLVFPFFLFLSFFVLAFIAHAPNGLFGFAVFSRNLAGGESSKMGGGGAKPFLLTKN